MLEATPASIETPPHPTLRLRVETRMAELQDALAKLDPDDRARLDLESALSQVGGLMTGDLDQIPAVVAAELSKWLEANKYLGGPRLVDPGPT